MDASERSNTLNIFSIEEKSFLSLVLLIGIVALKSCRAER